ncbi:DUF2244 domain-containing protein [Actimicrobium antarcticum]|uniref:DUF2244 domain-containing protein n=1 Tax=Actimicrobium antarcticum TaxID=1051899 RepID=UPI0031DCC6D4
MDKLEWVLKRNCSITPGQLAKFYASLCVVSLLLAGFFTFHGAWYVLIFSFVELTAVGAAFLYYARHACDRECIRLLEGFLYVELIESDTSRHFSFDVDALKVDAPSRPDSLVRLKGRGKQVEVGRFLTHTRRRAFAQELRQALASGVARPVSDYRSRL